MNVFLILEHPVSISALTSWLPPLSQYYVNLGPHIDIRDISWVNACVLSLPARKRSRILAVLLCLAGTGRAWSAERVARCCQDGRLSHTPSVSQRELCQLPGCFHSSLCRQWMEMPCPFCSQCGMIQDLRGSSVMVKRPSLLYEVYGLLYISDLL